MTPQEQQLIDGLIDRIRSTPVQNKDTDAERHIQQGLAATPDALYVLVQTVLVQQYGLEQAQAQLNELKQQVATLQASREQAVEQPKPSGGGFLSHIFGSGSNTPPPPPASLQQPSYQPVNNPPAQGYPAPPPPYPQSYPAFPGGGMVGGGGMFGGGGGFLQGALQTAAGVAAGEMVFQGMEDLFHGFDRGGGGGRGFGGGETIVNNYGDSDRGSDREAGDRDRDDGAFYNPNDDASRSGFSDLAQGGSDLGAFGGDAANFGASDSGSDDVSYADDNSGFDDNSGDAFSSGDNS